VVAVCTTAGVSAVLFVDVLATALAVVGGICCVAVAVFVGGCATDGAPPPPVGAAATGFVLPANVLPLFPAVVTDATTDDWWALPNGSYLLVVGLYEKA
jgi:hypothetical protein